MSGFDHLRPLIFTEMEEATAVSASLPQSIVASLALDSPDFENQVARTVVVDAVPKFPVAHQYSA